MVVCDISQLRVERTKGDGINDIFGDRQNQATSPEPGCRFWNQAVELMNPDLLLIRTVTPAGASSLRPQFSLVKRKLKGAKFLGRAQCPVKDCV